MIEEFALVALVSVLCAGIWRVRCKYTPPKIRVSRDFCVHSVRRYLRAIGMPDSVERMIEIEKFQSEAMHIANLDQVERKKESSESKKIVKLFD